MIFLLPILPMYIDQTILLPYSWVFLVWKESVVWLLTDILIIVVPLSSYVDNRQEQTIFVL